jgi:hypothetical protein
LRHIVSDSSRLDPDKSFPDDLTTIDRDDLDILNSRNHRSRDRQYITAGEVDAETEGEHHELREELDRRQAVRDASASTNEVTAEDDAEETAVG